MNRDLISIVVPVYNAEKYLAKCLESLISQTYKNIEILLIDDGSKDESEKICQTYQAKDARIIIKKQKNAGASAARNSGIDLAKGKYILFVDADDYVSDDYVEYLYGLIKSSHTDIAICSPLVIYNEKIPRKLKSSKATKVLSQYEVLEKALSTEIYFIAPWGKIFPKKLFENVRFPEKETYEDLATLYKLYLQCEKICCSDEKKYYYCIRENSLTTQNFSEKHFYRVLHADQMANDIVAKYPDLYMAGIARKTHDRLATLFRLISSEQKYPKEEMEIKKFLKENQKVIFHNKYVNIKDKLALISFSLGDGFAKFLWKIYKK